MHDQSTAKNSQILVIKVRWRNVTQCIITNCNIVCNKEKQAEAKSEKERYTNDGCGSNDNMRWLSDDGCRVIKVHDDDSSE